MCGRNARVKPNVVSLTPTIGLASEFIGDCEPGAYINAERGPVQPDRGLTRLMRVKVNYDENRIAVSEAGRRRTHALRKAQKLRAVWEMEAQVSKLL